MTSHLNLFSLALGVATVLIAGVGAVTWRNRDRPGSWAFLALLVGVGLWAFGNTIQLAATDLGTKVAFRTIAYVGHNIVPVSLLVFALAYTGRSKWVTRPRVAVLAAEPMLVALFLTPTNALGLHGLVWTDLSLASFGTIPVLDRVFGPMYWVNTAYNYLLVVAALYLLGQLVLQGRETGRMQGVTLLVAAIPPFLANVAWIGGYTPIDLTPFAFVITAIAFGLAMYRYRLFDMVPLDKATILDAIRDGYVVVDDRDRVLDMNETARKRMADPGGEIGDPLDSVLPEVADAGVTNGSREGIREEVEIDRGSGSMYVDLEVTTLQGRPGHLLILRDVTARRRVERRYRRLIEHSSDLIVVLDVAGRITYASPSWREILGYEPEAILGENAFEMVHPDDREAVRAEFEHTLENPDARAEAEYRFEHRDGGYVWLSSRGTNRFDDPVVEGFVVNSREVTKRKRRERALERQNERLDEFTSAVSHDLRNPLNVIQGRLQLAKETDDDEHFETIERAADRMETLIEDLLQLARQGREVGDPEPVELESLVSEVWESVATDSSSLEVESDLGTVAADPDRLYQLFENLLSNAVEHADDPVTVRVSPLPDGFAVSDDGPGIPEEERSDVFDRGYSTGEDGTGFGLSIVKRIASAHGWEIQITDGDLGGARFEITGVDRSATPKER